MTIASAWYKSHRTIFNLKMKINGLLSDPFTLILETLQDFPHLMFLYVVAFSIKVITHTFQWQWQGIKGVQTGDQEIKIVKFVDEKHFLRWHQLLCQTWAHSGTIREFFQLKNKLSKNLALSVSVTKIFWRSLTYTYLFLITEN